jgi:bifunctional non-homologous end joining protein LigD
LPKSKAETGIELGTISGARKVTIFPASFNPMLASLPTGPIGKAGTWVFEPKMDGIRCIAMIQGGVARLLSRRGLDLTSQYPRLAADLPKRLAGDGIVDGEIIALGADGRPSFQQLQQRMNLTRAADVERAEKSVPVQFFAFDMVRAGDYDLTGCTMSDRRRVLEALFAPADSIQIIPQFADCEGVAAYEVCVDNGFEGIVAKRLNSPYECGRRSAYWTKHKANQTGDFVIGGWSRGEGSRAGTFGSLLLGFYDADGNLTYCGSVGTGFDDRLLADTLRRLNPLVCEKPPFKNPPKDKGPCVWVAPQVVAEVKFMSMTDGGHLRAPVFLHFRDDKPPSDVVPDSLPLVVSPCSPGTVSELNVVQALAPTNPTLSQLSGNEIELELLVESEKIKLTSLNKELWPGITKRDYLRALTHLAPFLLPHWQSRPITLIRSPNGVRGKSFFQKHWHTSLPEFVETLHLEDDSETKEKLLCSNLASLLFFAQNGVLEFHCTTSRIDDMAHPDFIVFDLDYHEKSNKLPSELNLDAFKRAREVAFTVNAALKDAGLTSFVKLSGKNGIHLFVPIKRDFDHAGARALAETIGRFIVSKRPDLVTMEFETKKRDGKVYLDCGQNGQGRTIACPYTPRAVPWASVSMPVTWEQLSKVTPQDFSLHNIAETLKTDVWRDILAKPNDLEAALSKRAK